MFKRNRRWIWPVCYGALLISFTVYTVLDTFVIPRAMVPVTSESPAASGDTSVSESLAASGDTSVPESLAASTDAPASENLTAPEVPLESADKEAKESGRPKKKHPSKSESEKTRRRPENGGSQRNDGSGRMDDGGGRTDVGTGQTNSEGITPDTGGSSSGTVTTTANSYEDDRVSVTITEYREYDSTIYVADVELKASAALKTAFAESTYGRNITAKTSQIAESVGAILAINGDFYGAQERGYVIRNGVIYRDTAVSGQEDLVIYGDGSFSIIREDEVSAQELLEDGAVQVLSFGPALITEGEITVEPGEEVGKAMASNPRTAIAVTSEGHYLFVVSDGRTTESAGLSLSEMAAFLKSLGAETAYNLDGGGSSTMVFEGTVINHPTTGGKQSKERSVSDIVYIGV